MIGGTGTGEQLTGLLNTSGVTVQAFTTSAILTARAALTSVEIAYGEASGYFVMHPSNWAAIETSTLTAGDYVLANAGQGTPIDSSARRLWGAPVVTTTSCALNTGWFCKARHSP